jgi:hypothetical protein
MDIQSEYAYKRHTNRYLVTEIKINEIKHMFLESRDKPSRDLAVVSRRTFFSLEIENRRYKKNHEELWRSM